MPSENAVTNRVERSSPNAFGTLREERRDPIEHFASGLVGEGQQQDAARGHSLLEEPGYSVCQSSRLSASRARNNQGRAGR